MKICLLLDKRADGLYWFSLTGRKMTKSFPDYLLKNINNYLDCKFDKIILHNNLDYNKINLGTYDIIIVFSFFRIDELFQRKREDQLLIIIDYNFLLGLSGKSLHFIKDGSFNKTPQKYFIISAFPGMERVYVNNGFSANKLIFYKNFYNILPPDQIKFELGSYLLSAGKEQRDYELLIKAWDKINVKKCIITAKSEYPDLFIKKNINCIIRTYVKIFKLINYIINSKFIIIPLKNSPNTAQGLFMLSSSMSLGKCVLIADSPCIEGYVRNNKNVLLYRANDLNDLKNKIAFLNSNPQLILKIGRQAAKFAHNNNGYENVKEILISIFQNYQSI